MWPNKKNSLRYLAGYGNVIFSILFWVLVPEVGWTQVNTYSIRGKVTAITKEELPYALITIASLPQVVQADSLGQYVFRELPAGTYVLVTSYIGYKTRRDTVVLIRQSVRKDLVLTDALDTLEQVIIESSAPPHPVADPLAHTLSSEKVTQEFILKNQGNTLMNTLEQLPGISAIHTGAGISKPVIRGMSFNRVIVNEYGIKQEGQQWGIDHGLELDQYGVEEVEILKGPVSVLYGSDGLAGVINIRSPRLPTNDTTKAGVLFNYKSNNHLIGTSVSFEKSKKKLWAKARITWQDFADYKVPATEFQYNSYTLPIIDYKLKNTAGNELSYALQVGMKQKWGHTTLYLSHYGQKTGFFSGAFGIPRSYQLQDDGNDRDIQLPYQNIGHSKIISNTIVYGRKSQWIVDLGYQHNLRREHSYPHTHGQGPVPEGNLALQLRLQTFSYNLRWCYTPRPAWHLYIGSNGQHKRNRTAGFEFLIPAYDATQAGIYLLQDVRIRPALYWMLGVRWDWAWQQASATSLPVYDSDPAIPAYYEMRNPAIRKMYGLPTISSGLAWSVSKVLEAKYNLGTAFRFPTIPELASNGIHHGTFRHELGDPTLGVEQGILQDLSWQYRIPKWEGRISPFYYYFSNYIYLRPSARFSPLPDAGQIYRYTEGPVVMGGVELSSRYRFLKNWEWNAAFEYVRNRNTDLGYPLPFTPPLHIQTELEYTFSLAKSFPKNWIKLSWNYFSAQHRVDQNEKTTPDYTLLHLGMGAEWKYGRRSIQLQLQIRNLTDARYLNNMSRYRILNLPEQGRNIQISLRCFF
jgi:iron complex outermembrane receptor protein